MDTKSKVIPSAPPLPTKKEDLHRVIKVEPSLNDLVEVVFLAVYENPEYRRLIRAVHDSQAVGGSMSVDNVLAAQILKKQAEEDGSEVARENIHTIHLAHQVVLRRYGLDRKTRRDMVGGEQVPPAPTPSPVASSTTDINN